MNFGWLPLIIYWEINRAIYEQRTGFLPQLINTNKAKCFCTILRAQTGRVFHL